MNKQHQETPPFIKEQQKQLQKMKKIKFGKNDGS